SRSVKTVSVDVRFRRLIVDASTIRCRPTKSPRCPSSMSQPLSLPGGGAQTTFYHAGRARGARFSRGGLLRSACGRANWRGQRVDRLSDEIECLVLTSSLEQRIPHALAIDSDPPWSRRPTRR